MSEDVLARLADELEREVAGDRTIAVDDLAARFGVESKDVRACLAALQAMNSALGEDPPAVPALPPDYEMLGEIGRGGMGIVYRARQRSLDRVVAVKVLRPGDLHFGEMLRRFRNEASALARLHHRHIVSIHGVGESGGNVYYTMDCIEGGSLADLIERREITPARAVRIVRQVASAVAYVHSNGLIHRDLKPSNILIDAAGDAYVVDFGLARDAAKNDLTATGHILGTPAYMSPEQARGDAARIGEATDIYSLGTILYECLAGRPPFVRSSVADLLHDVIHRDPASPRGLNPQVPRDLEVICLKGMAKEPERRYPTMRAMLEDLERFEEGRPILARGPGLGYRVWRFAGRNVRKGISIVATLVISTMLWIWSYVPQFRLSISSPGLDPSLAKRAPPSDAAAA